MQNFRIEKHVKLQRCKVVGTDRYIGDRIVITSDRQHALILSSTSYLTQVRWILLYNVLIRAHYISSLQFHVFLSSKVLANAAA